MSRLPTGTLVWSLRRYTGAEEESWDRICGRCKQAVPVFEHEYCDEQKRSCFSYLCESCAQKKLAEWLQCASSPDYVTFDFVTDFDLATVYYEPKNEGEIFSLTRWSPEQRRRRLQQEP